MLREYNTILNFYRDGRTTRSGVLLMNHIDEGIAILRGLKASDNTIAAYCLHPIVQNDEDVDVTWSAAYPLACEYRDKANSYLCRTETDHIVDAAGVRALVGVMSRECAQLLLADKIQNQKDFLIYHAATHTRRRELKRYFELWLDYLLEFTMTEETVTISKKEYESLLNDRKWRLALESGGVDNWEWYSESLSEGGYFDD